MELKLDEKKYNAFMIISVGQGNEMDLKVLGQKEGTELKMMGSLDICKSFLMGRINKEFIYDFPNGKNERVIQEPNKCYTKNEKEVKKSDAVNHYLDMRTKIEKRLQKIISADDNSRHIIDVKFLDEL